MRSARRWAAFPVLLAMLLGVWLALPHQARQASAPVRPSHPPRMSMAVALVSPAATRITQEVRSLEQTLAVQQERVRRAEALLHQSFWLHAVGSQLYTAWRAPVTLKAINWYGFEYAPFVPGGLDKTPMDSILLTLHRLGFNALRITFADQTVEQNPVVRQGLEANPQLRGLHSLDIMQRVIERAHHFGLRVILCNSRSEAGRGPELKTGLWYTSQYTADAWMNDWLTLARRFQHDSAFVAADLRNEPHVIGAAFNEQAYFQYGPLWGAYHGVYYHDRDWHYAAQTLGNRLLAVNPHLLIVVEGVQMYLDPDSNRLITGLWGANLEGVQFDPIVLSQPGQLVYSVHEYGPHMWQGNWFNPGTTYQKLARRWDRLWGYLLTAQRALQAPIFVGEFGTCHEYQSCVDDPRGWKQGFWFRSFVRYMHEHSQVGWAYWSLNPDGPFQPDQVNYYSLATLDWQHYYPLITHGLAPLLSEPSGLNSDPTLRGTKVPAVTTMTPLPGCRPTASCDQRVTSFLQRRSISGPAGSNRPIAPLPARTLRVQGNVPYLQPLDRSRTGDLYLPQGASPTPRPALVLVHGGSWDQGGRGPASVSLARALAFHGYVVYDIDVRRVGQGGAFPGDIRDVKAAATYLRMHAARLGIDPWKIGAVGADVGGYLATMAAYTPSTGAFASPINPRSPGRIAAVASLWAPADLTRAAREGSDPADAAAIQSYLGATYAANPSLYGRASPTRYVATGVATVFFHGLDDQQAPFPQTFRLYRYLKQRAIPSELVDLPGAPHGLGVLQGALGAQVLKQMEAFFDGVFYKPPAPPAAAN